MVSSVVLSTYCCRVDFRQYSGDFHNQENATASQSHQLLHRQSVLCQPADRGTEHDAIHSGRIAPHLGFVVSGEFIC